MDPFEINKILGGVLGALLLTMALGIFSDILFYRPPPAVPGYDLPSGQPQAAGSAAAAPAAAPLPVLLAQADVQKGQILAKACGVCHNFEKGSAVKIGPPLYDVVGRQVASFAGFAYSDSLKKMGGTWTFDKLNDWITNPKAMASDTKMTYAGEPDPAKRADIIAYLDTLSDKPVPLPAVQKQAAENATTAPTAAPASAPAAEPLPVLLAKTDAQKGKSFAAICAICHSFEKGGGVKIGPPLYDVVGRPVASFPGFAYSDSLKKMGGTWTFDKLNDWIANPKAMANDTKMTYPGEPDPAKRADIIAYLDTLADKPVPLPAAQQGAGQAATPPTTK